MGAAFARVITLQLTQFTPEEAKRRHILIARAGLAAFLARQTSKPGVTIEVDGHAAASEAAVKPFGIIAYRFMRMREICAYALAQAEALSPLRSGRYKRSWFFLVDEQQVGAEAIPENRPVILTNDQPYTGKINTGSKGFEKYAPPGVVEKVRQLVIRRYGQIVEAAIEYITLAGGYKRRTHHSSGRKDRALGAALTYPSLLLTPRRFV